MIHGVKNNTAPCIFLLNEIGKTMVAAGLGLHAINSGYTVCFEKMVSRVKILDTAETERTAGFRLKNLKKAQLIIIDEIGYANRFFTFISDTYETSPLLFTTNKEIIDWAEMMGDPVLTTALLDRPDRLFSNSK